MPSKTFASIVAVAVAALACGPAEVLPGDGQQEENTLQLVTVAEVSASGLKATMLAGKALHVGRNEVFYRVVDEASGAVVKDATVTHDPLMQMSMHSHGCPLVQPVAPGADGDAYAGELVFTMASGSMGTWSVTVGVQRPGAEAVALRFDDVAVADSDAKKTLVVGEAGSEQTYIVALDFDAVPVVGMNPFVLAVYRKEGGMAGGFEPMSALAVKMTPQMPDMGHGSSGNVAPAHVAHGNYAGSVNLTMPGLWTIDFELKSGETVLGTVQYRVEP